MSGCGKRKLNKSQVSRRQNLGYFWGMRFKPYDPIRGASIYRKNLPHWQQPGVTYFVTFRLADSLPTAVLQELEAAKRQWLLEHGLSDMDALAGCEERLRWEFAKTFNGRWQASMDAGHGECWLRLPEHRKVVVEAMQHWHGSRWDLDLAVVMPNHVHALVTPWPEERLEELLHSVKRFSARAIHAALGRKGSFWQDESFDHIVRREAQLAHFRDYIRDNPKKAGLKEGEFWIGGGSTGFRSA